MPSAHGCSAHHDARAGLIRMHTSRHCAPRARSPCYNTVYTQVHAAGHARAQPPAVPGGAGQGRLQVAGAPETEAEAEASSRDRDRGKQQRQRQRQAAETSNAVVALASSASSATVADGMRCDTP